MRTIFNLRSFYIFLSRNKLYTFVTLTGFAIALAFVIIVAVFIQNETAVDNDIVDADRICLLTSHDTQDTESSGSCIFPPAIAQDLITNFPEIESTCRVLGWWDDTYKVVMPTTQSVKNVKTIAVDSLFFSMFTLPMVEGSASTALNAPDKVVISKQLANSLFGNSPAMGREIRFSDPELTGNRSYTVGGVVDDFTNRHLRPSDLYIRIDMFGAQSIGYAQGYNSGNYMTYIKTKEGADLRSKLPDILKQFKSTFWVFQKGMYDSVGLAPMEGLYFQSELLADADNTQGGDRQFIRILMLVVACILLFAVINYVNLTVAQSGYRAREMATRRLMGSPTSHIVARFMCESVIMCAVAFILALFIASAAQDPMNFVINGDIALSKACTIQNMFGAVGFIICLGVIVGVIPAFIITKYKPIEVVKGSFRYRTKKLYSRIFITFQYIITIVLIGYAIVIHRQTSYMMFADTGYNTQNIINVQTKVRGSDLQTLRSELLGISGISSVCFNWDTPLDGGSNQTVEYKGQEISFQEFRADSAFIPLLGIDVVSRTGINGYWVNETAAKTLGLKPEDSQVQFDGWDNPIPVAGICRDFHFRDFSQPIGPAYIRIMDIEKLTFNYPRNQALIAISGNPTATFKAVEQIYNRSFPDSGDFQAEFMDKGVQKLYENQQRQSQLITYISLIAIIISSLGILAMSTYFIRQRTHSIAIRKVFGAHPRTILRSLINEYLILVFIAFVVAAPGVWYLGSRWLSGYTYRIHISWLDFVATLGIIIAVTLSTILWQSMKATNANPVKSLKSE